MPRPSLSLVSLLCVGLVLTLGCGDKQKAAEPKEPESQPTASDKPVSNSVSTDSENAADAPQNTTEASINDGALPPKMGTVRGKVLLAKGAELPKETREKYWGGKEAPDTDKCAPPKLEDYTPVKMKAGRALSGLLVSATGDPTTFLKNVPKIPPQNRFVSIKDCRMTPRLVVATRGDYVHLTNNTVAPFVPTFGASPFNAALLPTQNKSWEVKRGGVQAVECKFGMACGKSDVVVLYHPVHTVSKNDATFELRVPSDQEVELHAWHPLFSDVSKKLTVKEGETVDITMTISPAATPAPSTETSPPKPAETK